MTPDNTEIVASASPVIVDTAELRRLAQVPQNSDAFDAALIDTSHAAQAWCSGELGIPVTRTKVIDRYSKFSTRMELSQTLRNETVTIKFIDSENAERTVAANDYVVDPTGERTAVSFINIPDAEPSGHITNPVSVSYDGAFEIGGSDLNVDIAKQAIRAAFVRMWNDNTGDMGAVIEILDRIFLGYGI